MKKSILFLAILLGTFLTGTVALAYEQFTAKVSSVNVDNGSYYDGTAYCEVSFGDMVSYYSDTVDDDTRDYTYYVIPIADEPNFPYIYAALLYASQKDKYVTIFSHDTWTRQYSDGSGSYTFGRISSVGSFAQ